MLVRQSKNTFIRFFDNKGYITNQMTRKDRLYNETGADFLRMISREAKEVDEIIEHLSQIYDDSVTKEKLRNDFLKFILDLEKHLFLITGLTAVECDSKDIEFSYSLGNMKNKVSDFTQVTEDEVPETTQDYILAADKKKPHLKSIQFELTSRCNERCIHCYIPNAKKNNGSDMTYEQACHIIDQFSDMGYT